MRRPVNRGGARGSPIPPIRRSCGSPTEARERKLWRSEAYSRRGGAEVLVIYYSNIACRSARIRALT